MHSRLIFLTMIFSVPSLPAIAEDTCETMQTQAEMTRCAAKMYQTSEVELRKATDAIFKHQKDSGQGHALIAAQRDWKQQRDADCAKKAAAFQGGSMQPMQRLLCKAAENRKRTEFLQAKGQ